MESVSEKQKSILSNAIQELESLFQTEAKKLEENQMKSLDSLDSSHLHEILDNIHKINELKNCLSL